MNGSLEAPFSLHELQTITLAQTYDVYMSQCFYTTQRSQPLCNFYMQKTEQGTVMNPTF